jgi:hypothetical protein
MLRCVITKSCRTNEIGASIRKSAFTEAIISSFEFRTILKKPNLLKATGNIGQHCDLRTQARRRSIAPQLMIV